jgi:carboxypeptidase-like protein/TonB-dependent receptor-like protein
MKKSIVLLFGIVCFTFSIVKGQNSQLYSGSYQQILFADFITELESNYNLKFYYSSELDSIQVNLEFKDVELSTLLNKLTVETQTNFFIKSTSVIISTGNFIINPQLENGLFGQEQEISTLLSDRKSILENIRERAIIDREEALENQVIEIGEASDRFSGKSAIISGYVKEVETGEPVVGASVFKKDPLVGVITDQFGYYSFSLEKGKVNIYVNSIGMKSTKRQVMLYSDGNLNFELRDGIISLNEVVVTAEKNTVETLQTGFASLNVKDIKQMPSAMGEADIMKIALTLPGVQTVGEGSSGFNVRGGSVDQNLVLLNDVPVYNTDHLFGFISVFNPDVLGGANLYKSGIGAHYGGRISSVFDVAIKDGNKKKFGFKGGVSPITAKLMVEGPIKKDTSSYIFAARSTYSDWIFSILDDPALRNSSASFYDLVGKVNHSINADNELVFSAYYAQDEFKLNTDSLYTYVSGNAALQWRHTFSNRLNAVSSISFANYNYSLKAEVKPLEAFELDYNIDHYSIKSEFNYFTKDNASIKFGISSTLYQLQPGSKKAIGESSLIKPISLLNEKGIESAIYIGSEYELSSKFSVYGGFRLSMFNSLGSSQSFKYKPDTPKEEEFISDTIQYSNNELIKTYVGPELRLSGRYKLRDDISVKLSFDRMNQYIHLLSNTASFSPTDTWRLSGIDIKPQIGNQFSLGFYKTFFGTSVEMSVEGYYKLVDNLLEYKDGADLLLNEALETDVIGAKGKSYGVEFLLKKNSGKFTGWLSYTYSRSLIQANGMYATERINNGEFYPSNYDKPHTAVIITNYKFNRRVNFSANFNYSTGRPATYPLAKYGLKNQSILLYTNRNQYRIPDYFRVDVAFNIEGNHKVHKKIHGSWSFSVYNLLGRSNAYSVFFKNEGGQINGYKLTVFKSAIPTITYHFKLQ